MSDSIDLNRQPSMGIPSHYKEKDLLESVEHGHLSMVSALALGLYINRFGESHVFSNLTDIELSGYRIPKEVQLHALRKNLLTRFSISSALRSVFSAMYEVMNHNDAFNKKIKSLLHNNYESFYSLITLLRNVYSHEITWAANAEILLKKTDFNRFLEYRIKKGKPSSISIYVDYSKILPDVKAPHGYGINLTVDLNKLADGEKLSSVISLYHQQIIAELCFNLCTFIA